MADKVWECKIGPVDSEHLPPGSDGPMRRAVKDAYKKLAGREADYCFSGWGGELTDTERNVVYNCGLPADSYDRWLVNSLMRDMRSKPRRRKIIIAVLRLFGARLNVESYNG